MDGLPQEVEISGVKLMLKPAASLKQEHSASGLSLMVYSPPFLTETLEVISSSFPNSHLDIVSHGLCHKNKVE